MYTVMNFLYVFEYSLSTTSIILFDRKFLQHLITNTSNFVKRLWMMIERFSEYKKHQKVYWPRSVTDAFRWSFVSLPFLWVVQALVPGVCGLLLNCDELSMFLNILYPPIILHTKCQKVEISCKSCNFFKSAFRSFASLNMALSRHTYSKTTCITLTNAKKNIVLLFVK